MKSKPSLLDGSIQMVVTHVYCLAYRELPYSLSAAGISISRHLFSAAHSGWKDAVRCPGALLCYPRGSCTSAASYDHQSTLHEVRLLLSGFIHHPWVFLKKDIWRNRY